MNEREAPSESDFMDFLEPRLIDEFGEHAVAREVQLPSDREPDFLVARWPVPLAIECENRAADVIGGAGQAAQYAAEADAHPVVLYPSGTGEDEMHRELATLNQRVKVRRVEWDRRDGGGA